MTDLEFVAKEWTRIMIEKARELGLSDGQIAFELCAGAYSLLSSCSSAEARRIISEEGRLSGLLRDRTAPAELSAKLFS